MTGAAPDRGTPSERHATEVESNRRLWGEWTAIHEHAYDVAGFRAGAG